MSRRKVAYPKYTTGQRVRLTSDIICTPDGKPPFVLFPVGQVGQIEGVLIGNIYRVNFRHWSGWGSIHASRLEAVATEDLTSEELEIYA